MATRYLIGVGLGSVVTFLLFFLMQAVIATDEARLDEGAKGKLLDFVRLEEDQELQTKQRKPKPPPPPDEPPPDMPKPEFESSDISQGVDVGAVDVNVNLNVEGGGFSSDGEYLPIVKVNPQYPRRAQTRGIEGYVLLEYIVTKTGAVRDPVVIEAKPPGIFNRAAINAALKYKYKPKVVNGEPIDVAGVKTRITFEMAD
ncbi:MAG: energy transducer TonB [Pseudomonadota bacterium]|jgi:protein TonB|nr:energy transducer TonB [Pseudomonadota bacterium]MEC7251831.1 energy transducer TonB [Pseudomonadota bacterium]MEC7379800.1 energy transducer TonB [Pseudomonadota bacterium]MEC7418707.1 energy transducer TonB [Pseudomonadota bacterium]MEC7780123.1 energy transducer TonB [Pseudomonadota bacterium]